MILLRRALAIVCMAFFMTWPSHSMAQSERLTVATWSGFHAKAYEDAVFKPFSRETGIALRIASHDGDLRPITDPDAGISNTWDVVEMERADLTRACAQGTVARLDHAEILGAGMVDDFLPGTLHPCGVGSLIWSQAVAYDATLFKEKPPRTLADFFDLTAYPGVRGLFDGAEGSLEVALMADGVPPDNVYSILRKPGGIERALAKLETLRGSIRFWRFADGPTTLLDSGDVVMSTVYAGRLLRPRHGARRPIGLMFSNQLWRATYLAIPTRQSDPINAFRLISFATDPIRQAQLASRLWFGPSRRAGLAAVPKNIRDDMPTARRYFHNALAVDVGYWSEFGAEAEAKFRAWQNR